MKAVLGAWRGRRGEHSTAPNGSSSLSRPKAKPAPAHIHVWERFEGAGLAQCKAPCADGQPCLMTMGLGDWAGTDRIGT